MDGDYTYIRVEQVDIDVDPDTRILRISTSSHLHADYVKRQIGTHATRVLHEESRTVLEFHLAPAGERNDRP